MWSYVSDEVWRQLDPGAGRLSRRTRIRGWIGLGVVAVLIVASAAVWQTGLVVPRLAWPGGLQAWEQNPTGVRVTFILANTGRFPATVLGIGRSGPGLEYVATEADLPATLAPGQSLGAVLVYRITDCTGYPRGSWPVTALVDRPWGTMTVDVAQEHPEYPWQEHVVSTWCRPGGPGG
jgi:hypothetical protein